jgi:hypothetical protein
MINLTTLISVRGTFFAGRFFTGRFFARKKQISIGGKFFAGVFFSRIILSWIVLR